MKGNKGDVESGSSILRFWSQPHPPAGTGRETAVPDQLITPQASQCPMGSADRCPDILNAATPNRKRKRSMSFRSGQSGTVVRKGKMWHGRYYVDVPGEETRRKASVPLGSVQRMKKNQAKRRLRAILEEMGLNEDTHLERAAADAKTFASEAAWWRENKLTFFKASSQETMGSHLDKYLLPRFGTLPIAAIDERRVQEFITDLRRKEHKWPNGVSRRLSPKTIRNIVGVLKMILGEKVWRDWNLTMPKEELKEQRWFTPFEMSQIINAATGQWKVLFATLAGTGMRCGEAFGLHVEDVDLAKGKITIKRGVWNGEEVSPKSKNGRREVNIEPALVQMLADHLGDRKGGRVFATRSGTPFCKSNVRRKLNQILSKLNLPPAGLHAFRHGRVSMLRASGAPDELVKDWVGHSNLNSRRDGDVTSRYTHFEDEFRQRMAAKTGLFAQQNLAEKLQFSPNGPNFGQFAGSREAR